MTDSAPRIRWGSVLLGFAALFTVWIFAGYNGLVSSRENVNAQWSQVQTQYQRRFDLVPNLVNAVKGSAAFEQRTLLDVTEARTKWMQPGASRSDQVSAAEQLDSTLSRLLVTVESYPQLSSTQAFRDLMAQLEGTENRIGNARRDYNEAVQLYNVRVKRFPGRILAAMFGFAPEAFFQSAQGSDQAPLVNF